MTFDLSWHVENWNAPCDDIDYSKKTSLEVFLKKEKVSDNVISTTLSSKTMFWDALKELNPINQLSNNQVTIFNDESSRFRNILLVRTMENNKSKEVFEVFFSYLLMRIAVAISWDFQNQNTSYEPAYEEFLTELTNKNAKYIYKLVGKTEISCFFLAHKRSNELLETIIDSGLEYINTNSKSKNTPMGNIYLTIKSEVIDALIKKIFEIIYTNPEFSLKNLLFQDKVLKNVSSDNLKYDTTNWKQQHGFYLIPENMQAKFYSDLSLLNPVIENAINIEKKLKNTLIDIDKLNFDVLSNDKNDFCYIKYEPLTETGRKSKYPLILHFITKNNSMNNEQFGDVFLMEDNMIGKARIINWINNTCYVISVTRVKDQLQLSNLETRDTNGNSIVLYKKTKT